MHLKFLLHHCSIAKANKKCLCIRDMLGLEQTGRSLRSGAVDWKTGTLEDIRYEEETSCCEIVPCFEDFEVCFESNSDGCPIDLWRQMPF